ncbi:uncharacterized protein N7459_001494 [Penicillium hispanicum]|uniref:uncharacterized protein n=1 Tax=Penicillium hispanicum TaxID=1080232 RepID=UPI0025423E5F|nr:uncharacterized protein N7459_001494 [Penicillium hispanicum]KAJ5595286.1 hypothetical protein N7459_001494 [Penicillium hispanicum]
MHAQNEPHSQLYQSKSGSDQNAATASPGQGRDHLQSTTSPSSKLVSQSWPASARDLFSYSPDEHEYARSTCDKSHDNHHQKPVLPTQSKKHSSPEMTYDFVIEDPRNSQTFREKRRRTRLDIEKQKECIRLLKEFGGACLWCYRSKKRCGATNPCPSCVTNHRKCIRTSAQLSLVAPLPTPPSQNSMPILGPPSKEVLDALQLLGDRTFQNISTFNSVINIRDTEDASVDTWVMEITKPDLDISLMKTRHAVDNFVSKASTYIHYVTLAKFQSTYLEQPLVRAAIKMAKLCMVIGCLAKTRVHIRSFDIAAARLTLLLLLVACCRELADMSDGFSIELCEMLRRKIMHDICSNGKNQPQTANNLNSVWVATALYYRTVSGLLDLQTSPMIEHIFKPLVDHLATVRSNLFSILKSVPASPMHSSRSAIKQTLNDQVPVLPSSQFLDLAFWLGPVGSHDGFSAPSVLKRQGDPFAEQGYDMQSLLYDEFIRPFCVPTVPAPVVLGSLEITEAPSEESIPDRVPTRQASHSPIDPDMFDDVLGPPGPTPWDMVNCIDGAICEYGFVQNP